MKIIQSVNPVFGDITHDDFGSIIPPDHDDLPEKTTLHYPSGTPDNLIQSISAGQRSLWFRGLGAVTKKRCLQSLQLFINWLNSSATRSPPQLLLREYESWQVNTQGIKPQSVRLDTIIQFFTESLSLLAGTPDTVQYIESLLARACYSLPEQSSFKHSLTEYFSSIPSLRYTMTEQDIRLLESPGLLLDSFTISIAATSIYILNNTHQTAPERPAVNSLLSLIIAWLCAAQGIQSSDILKLTPGNFARINSSHDETGWLQIRCLRSSTGTEKSGPMLNTHSVEAIALESYLQWLEKPSCLICSRLPDDPQDTMGILCQLWGEPYLSDYIFQHLHKRQSSPVFINAFLAMMKGRKESQNISIPLHIIKSTAVQARLDEHSCDTLKNHGQTGFTYLTDANKQWTNRHGRINRFVLNNTVESLYRTGSPSHRVPVQTPGERGFSWRSYLPPESVFTAEPDYILVLDSSETVVMMLYYIFEAERQLDALLKTSPLLLEQIVVPYAQWMHQVLQNLISPKAYQQGKRCFEKIRHHLPALDFLSISEQSLRNIL